MLSLLLAAATIAADTSHALPDTIRSPVRVASPVVQIVADDSTAAPVVFTTLGAEVRLEVGIPAKPGKPTSAPAELHLTKRTDALTSLFAARVASGRRLYAVTVELPGAKDTLRVRLLSVAVTAERIVFPVVGADLEGERLAQEMSVNQLTVEREDAARQLAEAEALAGIENRDQRKLVPANAIARAHDQIRLLDLRLASARRQLAIVEERVARGSAATEEVTLRAERAEVLGGGVVPND